MKDAALFAETSMAQATPRRSKHSQKTFAALGKSLVELWSHAKDDPQAKTIRNVVVDASQGANMSRRLTKSLFEKARISHYVWRKRLASSKTKKKVHPKRGRPKGSFRVQENSIRAVLAPHTVPSCRFTAAGKVIENISTSWRRLHRTDALLRDLIPRRTLARRVQNCKMQVAKGRGRTDVCMVCKQWDSQVSVMLKNTCKEIRDALENSFKQYFSKWDRMIAAHPKWGAEDFEHVADPDWAKALCEYVSSHRISETYARLDLPERDRNLLESFEDRAVKELSAHLPIIDEWSMHFTVRDVCQEALAHDLSSPNPHYLYCLTDYQDKP